MEFARLDSDQLRLIIKHCASPRPWSLATQMDANRLSLQIHALVLITTSPSLQY